MAQDKLRTFLTQINDALAAPEDRKRLSRAQAAWIRERDLTCDADAELHFGSGSGRDSEFVSCLLTGTNLRLNELHSVYDRNVERTRRQSQ